MSDLTEQEIKDILDNAQFTFSVNCRSGLADHLPEGKCQCWRCRKERGEEFNEETENIAKEQAKIADEKHKERMKEFWEKQRANKMKKFDCEQCPEEEWADYGLMDGYSFGDTLLEGVMFQVSVNQNNEFTVKIDPDSEKYFEKLNTGLWLDRAKKFAEKKDLFQCPNCGNDCYPL